MKIKQLKLSTKLWLGFMGLVVFALVSGGVISYYHTYESLKSHGTQTLTNGVFMAKKVMELQQNNFLEGDISLESAKRDVLTYLSSSAGVELGDHGYFVVTDSAGLFLVHPSLTNTHGYDLRDFSDERKYFLKEAIDKAKSGGGFITYKWTYPNSDKMGDKIMYASYYEPWD